MNLKMHIVKYFDRAFLGLATLWLVGAMANFATASDFDPGALNERIELIERYTRDHQVSSPTLPDWRREVQENFDSNQVPGVKSFPAWVLHKRPNIVFEFFVDPGDRPLDVTWKGPQDLKVTASREDLTLTWKMPELPSLLVIDELHVLRAKRSQVLGKSSKKRGQGGSQVFKSIAKLKKDARRYTDKNANHRIEYIYKILVKARFDKEHPLYRAGLILPNGERKKESQVSKGTLLPIRFIVPLGVRLPGKLADIDAKSRVDLRVYLFDAKFEKKWIFRDYWNVKEGELIGSVVKKRGRTYDFRMGKLVNPRIRELPNPKIPGHMKKVYELEVRYPDSTVEKYSSRTDLNRLKGS